MSFDLDGLRKRLTSTRRKVDSKKIKIFLPIVVFFFFLLSTSLISTSSRNQTPPTERPSYTLNCSSRSHYPSSSPNTLWQEKTCPDYFRWIHEDLRPWRDTGITRDMVERARKTAHFRLVIVAGKVYIEKYRKAIQTRDVFTIWGVLQLLRWYPGKVPDLELMFDCDDRPVVPARDFERSDSGGPTPVFRYCSDEKSLDIVFPDWSFWGWAEINIKPWGAVLEDIKEGNRRTRWRERVPYAYWKGNPHVAPGRRDLLRCNVSEKHDWNARLYIQDWIEEGKVGFKQSNLEDQCTHRYKIYIEGWAWSVSEKYILACDSMTLIVHPLFHDFFSRGMLPFKHYWPIRDDDKCRSLQFAVEWGNNHTHQAEEIGSLGSGYMHDNVNIDYVYDYMFHLLSEYAKLLRFKPMAPMGVSEVYPETLACAAEGRWKKFMMESLVTYPTDGTPCTIHPSYDSDGFAEFVERRKNLTMQIRMWEDDYWRMHH